MAVAAEKLRRRTRPAQKPVATRRRPTAQRRMASGVLVIVAVAALLAGVVALNVAVLRLNIRLDDLGQERAKLRAENAALASKLASSAAAGRIQQAAADRLGVQPAILRADPLRRRRAVNRARRQSDRRIRLLLGLLLAVFAVALSRAVWLQTVRAQGLSERAASQQHETVAIAAGRGTLLDRMGVQLAIGEEATTVYANPKQVRNARAVSVAAADALHIDADALYPQLVDKSKGFVYVKRKADPEDAKALEQKHLSGLGFIPEERRVYPQGGVAAQVLGYAGTDNRGLAGLELQLDRYLAGRPGSETFVKDPFGRVLDVVRSVPERPGKDVFLTLDHTIQANVESVLRSTVSQWGAKRATAVVLDPETGGILAMAVAPGYDANRYPSAPADLHRNTAVTDTYEPGSTFKLVSVVGRALRASRDAGDTVRRCPAASTSPTG